MKRPRADRAASPARRAPRPWLPIALIVVAGFAAYAPALSSPFLFDDQTAIVNNPQIRTLRPLLTALSPPRDTPVAGRPLVNLSLAVNYAAGGLHPRGYRIVNLAIHLLAGLVLLALLGRLFALPSLSAFAPGSRRALALVIALFWTLHPLNTEVVNYIAERTESMMALCYLLTMYCAIRALESRVSKWTGAAIMACAAGMLCKESMVTAPVMVVLIDRILVFDSWRETFKARGRLYGGLAATWVVLGAILVGVPRTSAGFGSGVSAWTYLLNQARIVSHYIELAIWPRALVLDYGLPQPLALTDVVLPAVTVVGFLVATVVALVRWPIVGLLGAWFFITLAPTSSLVPIATEVGAERRMYLPLIALVVLAVVPIAHALDRTSRTLRIALATGVAALMIAGVVARGREYASPLAMAQTIVDRWPNGRGHFLLGSTLIESGQQDAGMVQMRESARDYPGALFAIATEELGRGQIADGIATIQRFIRAMPGSPSMIPARDMLGRAYAIQGDLAAAEEQARLIVELAPRYASGHDLRARVYANRGQYAAAATEFQQVIELEPGNTEARQNLADMRRRIAGVQ